MQTQQLQAHEIGTGAPSPAVTKLINYFRAEIAAGKPFPDKAQIMEHMGWKQYRDEMMLRLETAGLIKRDGFERVPGMSRVQQKWRLA